MIQAFHEQAAVEAVRIIYITETIDHMLKDVKMDCDVCNLKPVCDEVEGLRELHFAQ